MMLSLWYRLLRQDPKSREGVIVSTSALGILVNLLLACVKVAVGSLVSSIAIISEGIDNAADSGSSLITIIGTKLSGRKPTKKHPFGFGRIEFLTSLVIAVIILVTGSELMLNAIRLIREPQALSVSYVTLFVIAASACVKLALSAYTIRQGKRIDSGALIAVGRDCRNDCIVSVITILASLVFLVFHVSVDAYAGMLVAVMVLRSGFEVLKETVSDLLGEAGDKELADQLYEIIRSEPVVLNAADMMLHNYGPDAYSGSVNIEVDHEKTIGEVYAVIHALQLKIMREFHIIMVFGMYAVDQDHADVRQMREKIAAFVEGQEHVTGYHALYIDPENHDVYCDLVVDYELKDWDRLRKEFTEYMNRLYPENHLELVIETDYV